MKTLPFKDIPLTLSKIYKRHNKSGFSLDELKISTQRQGNFTVCLLRHSTGVSPMSVGVSKRNCDVDEYNARIGEEVAFSNAVRALCNDDPMMKNNLDLDSVIDKRPNMEEVLKMPEKEYERMLKRMYPDGD